ncbi:hypothetical protein GOODEAATRI_006925 [Goodea atripinnis]|uniref:Uncharacterized protein n=1 Tax=Goodea atripinnis TaxID=208336 RepID=A0ABV0P571_9TELE
MSLCIYQGFRFFFTQTGVLWVGTGNRSSLALNASLLFCHCGKCNLETAWEGSQSSMINNFLFINSFWMSSQQCQGISKVNAAEVCVLSLSFLFPSLSSVLQSLWREAETVYCMSVFLETILRLRIPLGTQCY